jgi:primosomal protein N' (replication factor Y) (superfamily II helicase)
LDKFAEIVFDIPVDSKFTYSVPDYLQNDIKPGMRVLCPFGNRYLTGFLITLKNQSEVKDVKSIKSIADTTPSLSPEILQFSDWISDYYAAPLGEVVSLFVPKKFSVKSEMTYALTEEYTEKVNSLENSNDLIFDIISAIKKSKDKRLSKKQVEKQLKGKPGTVLDFMVEKGILTRDRTYSDTTQEMFVKFLKAKPLKYSIDETVKLNKLKSPKQIELLEMLSKEETIELSRLKNYKIPYSTVNSMLKKNLIDIFDIKKERKPDAGFEEEKKDLTLNDEQQNCLDKISESIHKNEFKTYLIHGITGSGKTEVYIRLLKEVINQGRTGIVLVPEISLTPQLIRRFRNHFESKVGVIHSKLSEGERLDAYLSIKEGKYKVIVGPRSALFAPLENIGIIVVDEEHESSYKQENSPRYNARDMAIVRGMLNNAPVVLGSATPSVDSYYNAVTGKYELLKLTRRATEAALPLVKIINPLEKYVSDGFRQNEIIEKSRQKFLSKELLYAIDDRLERKESVILLQNRRGYHSYIECMNCNHVEMCDKCNLSLTYHKQIHMLKCHICGFVKQMITHCKECGSTLLVDSGAGTEKIEEELIGYFPDARIERMDSDTMVSKYKYQKVLNDFHKGNIDILVGTQIISKGLDFPNVTLVGVVNADIGLLIPDFRATERTFQLLTQVSGRSGRSEKPGEVIIQTKHREYKLFDMVASNDYAGFFKNEIETRKDGNYPPFTRFSIIEVKSKSKDECFNESKEIHRMLKSFESSHGLMLTPPIPPLISKIKDYYRYHIIIRTAKKSDPAGKKMLHAIRSVKSKIQKSHTVRVTIDIDALNLI